MYRLIKKCLRFFIKTIHQLMPIKPKHTYLDDIQCVKHLVFQQETFFMPESKDIFGNAHQYFNEYEAQIPDFYVRELPNAYFFTGREEVWTDNKEIVLDHTTQKENPMKYKFINFKKAKRINGRVLNLCLNGLENNYYHWLVECLGRLYILKNVGINPDYYVVRDSLPFQKQWLELFGITQDKIIYSPDSGGENILVVAESLLLTTLINNWELIQYLRGFPAYRKIWLPSWIGKQYKEITRDISKPSPENKDKKIYVTRKNAKYRKVVNEDELKKILDDHNYEIIDLDNISVIEQITIFNSAKMIIGVHGAGLANIFFCRDGSKLLEIYPIKYFDSSFRLLALNLNIGYTYIICDEVNEDINPQKANISVNKEFFENALNKFDQL